LRAVVQRVVEARVVVDDEVVGETGPGLCVLLGVAREDDETAAERLAAKVARLRIFENEDGKFDRSVLDTSGAALVVSNFTLLGDTKKRKGTRPDFSGAAPRQEADSLYGAFCAALAALGVPVATGTFGARMRLEIVNDGPVTIVLDVD
jgi:D-tyrosyl-tRNA(Tyr) deacylase